VKQTEDDPTEPWKALWEARRLAFETVLGPAADTVLHAVYPFYLGGSADVLEFTSFVAGHTFVTADLVGDTRQLESGLGQYELMICTRAREDWAPNLISRLARYTLDATLEPLHTMDIGPALPKHSTLSALLFAEPDVPVNQFTVLGRRCGLLLCIGITEPELWACQRGRQQVVLAALRDRSVFPFTDLRRKSVI
jgi:hypothetical protein